MAAIVDYARQRIAHLNYDAGWPVDIFIPFWSLLIYKLKTKELIEKIKGPDLNDRASFIKDVKHLENVTFCHKIGAVVQTVAFLALSFFVHPLWGSPGLISLFTFVDDASKSRYRLPANGGQPELEVIIL